MEMEHTLLCDAVDTFVSFTSYEMFENDGLMSDEKKPQEQWPVLVAINEQKLYTVKVPTAEHRSSAAKQWTHQLLCKSTPLLHPSC